MAEAARPASECSLPALLDDLRRSGRAGAAVTRGVRSGSCVAVGGTRTNAANCFNLVVFAARRVVKYSKAPKRTGARRSVRCAFLLPTPSRPDRHAEGRLPRCRSVANAFASSLRVPPVRAEGVSSRRGTQS